MWFWLSKAETGEDLGENFSPESVPPPSLLATLLLDAGLRGLAGHSRQDSDISTCPGSDSPHLHPHHCPNVPRPSTCSTQPNCVLKKELLGRLQWWSVFLRGNKNQARVWKTSSFGCLSTMGLMAGEGRRKSWVLLFCTKLKCNVSPLSVLIVHPTVLPLKVPISIQVRTWIFKKKLKSLPFEYYSQQQSVGILLVRCKQQQLVSREACCIIIPAEKRRSRQLPSFVANSL